MVYSQGITPAFSRGSFQCYCKTIIKRLINLLGLHNAFRSNTFRNVTLVLLMVIGSVFASQAQTTYFLTTGGAGNAQTPGNWNTGGINGGGTAAANFTTSGDVFIVSLNNAVFSGNNTTTTFGTGVTLKFELTGSATTVSNHSIIINGTIEFSTAATSQLTLGGGNASFSLGENATFITPNQNGIHGNATNQSINDNGRSVNLSVTANYVLSGANQTTTGLPATVNNLTLSGSGTKTLAQATTATGRLTVESGVTLNAANTSISVGSLTGAGNITHTSGTAGAPTITIGSDNTTPPAYAGIISNGTATSVSVVKNGTGKQIFSGANTYTGATSINAGTLRIEHNTGLGTTAGTTTVASTAALELANGITTAEPIAISGIGGGSGALLNGAGNNTLSGNITLNAASTIGSTTGTLTLSGTISGNNNKTFAGAGSIVASNTISGTGTVNKTGTGVLTFSGSNTFSDALNIQNGIFAVATVNDNSANGPLGNSTNAITLGTGTTSATFRYTGSEAGSTNKAFSIAAAGAFFENTGSATVTLSAANTLTGPLSKSGTGAVALTGLSSNTGNHLINVTAGILQLNRTGGTTLPDTTPFTVSGGTLKISQPQTTANLTLTSSGTLEIDENVAFTINNNYTGGGTLVNQGTLSLAGNSAITFPQGTTVSTLRSLNIATSGGVSLNDNLSFNDNGSLLIGSTATLTAGTRTIAFGTGGSVTVSGTLTTALSQGLTGDGALFGTLNNSSITLATESTVEYNGAEQIITGLTYSNLVVSGTSTKSFAEGASVANNFAIKGTAQLTANRSFTVNGNVTIDNGASLNGGNFNHSIGGNFSNLGSFTSGTGTITFHGSGTNTLTGTNSFYNLVVNKPGGSISASGALAVTNDLRVNSGTFNSASTYHNVIIESGATFAAPSAGTITVTGNWTNDGNFTANNSTVIFAGTTTQTIGGTQTTTFAHLTMNGSGDKVLGISTVSTGTLSLLQGKLFIGTHKLQANNSSGGSASSYVVTNGTGRLSLQLEQNSTKRFPIGLSAYNPIELTNTETTDRFNLRVSDEANSNANDPGKTISRRWFGSKDAGGTSNLVATFAVNTSDEGYNESHANETVAKIGAFSGEFWSFVWTPIISANGSTVSYTIDAVIPNINSGESFLTVGYEDAFDPDRFTVSVAPQNPALGVPNSIITVKSVNSQLVPTWVKENTSFNLTDLEHRHFGYYIRHHSLQYL